MTTTENNKIIAKFMNHKENMGNKGLLYHSDWSWLMEVVEKIERQGYNSLIEFTNYTENICSFLDSGASSGKGDTKIEAVYNACVMFIKWYNKNSAKEN